MTSHHTGIQTRKRLLRRIRRWRMTAVTSRMKGMMSQMTAARGRTTALMNKTYRGPKQSRKKCRRWIGNKRSKAADLLFGWDEKSGLEVMVGGERGHKLSGMSLPKIRMYSDIPYHATIHATDTLPPDWRLACGQIQSVFMVKRWGDCNAATAVESLVLTRPGPKGNIAPLRLTHPFRRLFPAPSSQSKNPRSRTCATEDH